MDIGVRTYIVIGTYDAATPIYRIDNASPSELEILIKPEYTGRRLSVTKDGGVIASDMTTL